MLMEIPKRKQEAHWESVDEHWQRFSVAFEYPVYFTEGVFRSSNPLLWQTMCRLEPTKRHRVLVFVDAGLLVPRPDLLDEISAYAALNQTRLDLVADPIAVPGGERIKDGFHYVEAMQRNLLEHHIDRHSYVVCRLLRED
jgi:3-dehydroquinate synthase